MTDRKISELPTLTGEDAPTGALIPVVDTTDNTTKRMNRGQFFRAISDATFGADDFDPGIANTREGLALRGSLSLINLSRSAGNCINANRNSDGATVNFRRDGNIVGSISVTTTATAYNTSSDYRLKEDLQPIADACQRLMALKPVNFAWKSNGQRVDGFIAHEVAGVVPEAVSGEKDAVDEDGNPEYQGIDQSKLVALLTAALQDAIKRIEALEAQ